MVLRRSPRSGSGRIEDLWEFSFGGFALDYVECDFRRRGSGGGIGGENLWVAYVRTQSIVSSTISPQHRGGDDRSRAALSGGADSLSCQFVDLLVTSNVMRRVHPGRSTSRKVWLDHFLKTNPGTAQSPASGSRGNHRQFHGFLAQPGVGGGYPDPTSPPVGRANPDGADAAAIG